MSLDSNVKSSYYSFVSEISCISSQQTLPMSLAVHQRRKAASPTHARDRGSVSSGQSTSFISPHCFILLLTTRRNHVYFIFLVGVGRPRSLVMAPTPGPGSRYESDSSSPSDKHHPNHSHNQQVYGYRQHAHTPSRRSSKSQDNGG